jgi:hypothetical protein
MNRGFSPRDKTKRFFKTLHPLVSGEPRMEKTRGQFGVRIIAAKTIFCLAILIILGRIRRFVRILFGYRVFYWEEFADFGVFCWVIFSPWEEMGDFSEFCLAIAFFIVKNSPI